MPVAAVAREDRELEAVPLSAAREDAPSPWRGGGSPPAREDGGAGRCRPAPSSPAPPPPARPPRPAPPPRLAAPRPAPRAGDRLARVVQGPHGERIAAGERQGPEVDPLLGHLDRLAQRCPVGLPDRQHRLAR